MAKRRNLKKEKALRNKAYARKFRKRTNDRRRTGGFYRQGGRSANKPEGMGAQEESQKESS